MTPVILDWQKPSKGMEIIQAARFTDVMGKSDNHVFRSKEGSDSVPFRLEVKDLENPVVVRFINARREGNLLGFMSTYGQVSRSNYVIDVEFNADDLAGRLFYSTNSTQPKERERWVNAMLEHVRLKSAFKEGRVVLLPENLYGLMAMEVALAHEVGARTTQCEHCETVYLTGPLTWRRSHSRFCSDSCRLKWNRKSKKEGARNG
ncbi:hypothetical protein EN742_24595 [Mesorhizobium sp. M4A.F.Ca.ET.020.02.1.1]|uniref:hypothetical protein n=1 Tax=unclassified Mesorhizobium TaxID=325217 RepID=UPI000FD2F140|nr:MULTISPECIES: hypothetical protein [unclassified Mesorhizobium]RVD35608.1 hypothetical protein EN742_24595 [Mesorhizobium sp. M4A.F.Ca.ET.020.02.1.1]RWC20314.1 MAG: hypothetical protein EOS53_10005 [Mesorhizobium sp.]